MKQLLKLLYQTNDGNLQFLIDKMTEAWWDKLFVSEPTLDTTKLNCNRPMEDLPQDTQAMIRKMQWDNQQKLLGELVDCNVNAMSDMLIQFVCNRQSNFEGTFAARNAEKGLEC